MDKKKLLILGKKNYYCFLHVIKKNSGQQYGSKKENNSIHFNLREKDIKSIKIKSESGPETVFLFVFFVTETLVFEKFVFPIEIALGKIHMVSSQPVHFIVLLP